MDLTRRQRDFIRASDDLGIRTVVPASVSIGKRTLEADALFPGFGDRNGMLVVSDITLVAELGGLC